MKATLIFCGGRDCARYGGCDRRGNLYRCWAVGAGVTVGQSPSHERRTTVIREREPRDETVVIKRERREPREQVIIHERD